MRLASASITSAPNALLLRPEAVAARSTTRFSSSERYTTNLNGRAVLGRRCGTVRGVFIRVNHSNLCYRIISDFVGNSFVGRF